MNTANEFPVITADVAAHYINTARLTPNAVTARIRQLIGPTMRRECGWCGLYLGERRCDQARAGTTTHGICPACETKHFGVRHSGETAVAGHAVRGSSEELPATATISTCAPLSSTGPSAPAKDSREGE